MIYTLEIYFYLYMVVRMVVWETKIQNISMNKKQDIENYYPSNHS